MAVQGRQTVVHLAGTCGMRTSRKTCYELKVMSDDSAVISAHFLAVSGALKDVTIPEVLSLPDLTAVSWYTDETTRKLLPQASLLFTYLCACFLDFCGGGQKLPPLPNVNNEAIQRSRARLDVLVDLRSTPVMVRQIWTAGLPCVAASLLSSTLSLVCALRWDQSKRPRQWRILRPFSAAVADENNKAKSSESTTKSLRSIFLAAPAPMMLSILQRYPYMAHLGSCTSRSRLVSSLIYLRLGY